MTSSTAAPARHTMILAAMTLANAMILVDQTAVPLALPDIASDFGISSALVQWVLTASLLPLAGLLVLGGKLGDLLGRRRIFMIGSIVFAGASAIGGFAPSFPILLIARVCQGAGGAMMLPATVAILSAAYDREQRGRALGLMGGIAATAGALGPTIGGTLTSLVSWRAVLLINLPLLVVTVWATLRSVPPDPPREERTPIDLIGATLIGVTLVGLVFGLAQSTLSGWAAPEVLLPLVAAVVAGVLFVLRERRIAAPLMDLHLLRANPNYLAATISQGLAGMAEMGLGLILPLVLVLNLQLDPALAGLALLATTVPMVLIAPLVGNWYDRAGGRPPLVVGFALLALSGVLLAMTMSQNALLPLLPGLIVYGIGLAVVLTVNDPVSIDTVPEHDHGEASGVSATAEQGGGAVGIALLYAILHVTYLQTLESGIAERGLPPLTDETGLELRAALEQAQQTGLRVDSFDPAVVQYVYVAETAADRGYVVAFLAVTVLSLIGLVACARLVRRPPPDEPADQPTDDPPAAAEATAAATATSDDEADDAGEAGEAGARP